MSINTIDTALDFLPEAPRAAAKPARTAGALGTVKAVISAIGDGLVAARSYEDLRARGVSHEKAIAHIFKMHFSA
jgi:hypothetical protein